MKRIYLSDLKEHVGETVSVQGWVHTIRKQGGILFLILRDRTGTDQAIVFKGNAEAFKTAQELSLESVVSVTGLIKVEKQAPHGYEIDIKEITVLSKAHPELPIPVMPEKGAGESDQPIRFDWRWLDLRTAEKLNIFKVWTELERGFRNALEDEQFIQIYAPSLMSTASESGAEVFEVAYFDRKAYLAQSPQFYKQMAMAAGFERVFMTGPVFRAELSYTTRHMTEFTGWDFEMSFIESHHDVMDMEEKLLVAGFTRIKANVAIDIEVPKTPFPRIPMAEAKAKLKTAGVTSEKEGDLSPEEERKLSAIIKEETGSDFVFVTDYPITVRPFYHMRHTDNPKLTKSFDLLYKGVEVTTGAQREHRVNVLEAQAKEKSMDLNSLADYINFFRYGCPPHGGVGIGPGRIVMQILNLASVKEATLLPRDVKRLTP